MRKKIIVGIDPGIHKGIAVLDLSGNLLYLGTLKNAGEKEVIELITSIGEVVAISSDVVPVPSFVRAIAGKTNSVLIAPKQSLSKEEKLEIAKHLGKRGPHEIDAYAAAIKAFRKFQNRFRNVEKLDLPEEIIEELKKGIIEGKAVDQILKKSEEETKEIEEGKKRKIKAEKIIDLLTKEEEETISQLKKVITYQNQRIKELEQEVKKWKKRARHLERIILFLRKSSHKRQRRS